MKKNDLDKIPEKKLLNNISKEINELIEKYKNSYYFRKKDFCWNREKDWIKKMPNWGDTEKNIETHFYEYINLPFSFSKILLGSNLIWILINYLKVLNSCFNFEKRKEESFFKLKDIYIEKKDMNYPSMSILEAIGKYSQKPKINILTIRNILIHPLGEWSKGKNGKIIEYDKYRYIFCINNCLWIKNRPRISKELWLIINKKEFNDIFLSALKDILNMILEINKI